MKNRHFETCREIAEKMDTEFVQCALVESYGNSAVENVVVHVADTPSKISQVDGLISPV